MYFIDNHHDTGFSNCKSSLKKAIFSNYVFLIDTSIRFNNYYKQLIKWLKTQLANKKLMV